ncbi:MAG: hypothetical protein KC492_16980 [Myxococcales bacterium]|nr:hypothetical protein [Myxococcales bacterium]
MLYDLIVGPANSAEQISSEGVPTEIFEGASIKPVDTVKLEKLQRLLLPDADVGWTGEPSMTNDEGPWVFRLPPEFVSALNQLGGAEHRRVLDAWAATEEFALDRVKPRDVAECLSIIQRLAARARETQQSLFLWMSL